MGTAFLRYGDVGLVVGYFCYYYLYAGNWDYYCSEAWLRQPDQLASLLSPGLYIWGVNTPKLFAVPLVLGVSTTIVAIQEKDSHPPISSAQTVDLLQPML